MKFSSAVPSSRDGDIFPHPKAFEKFIQSQTNSLCSTRLLSHFPLSPTLSLYNKSSREACRSLTKILLFLPCLFACVCPPRLNSILTFSRVRAGVSTFTSSSLWPFRASSVVPWCFFSSVCLLSSGGQHVQYGGQHVHFSLFPFRSSKGG